MKKSKILISTIIFLTLGGTLGSLNVFANPKITEAEEKIRQLDNKIETSIENIDKLKEDMLDKQIEIEKNKIEIENSEIDLNNNSVLMQDRLNHLYKTNSSLLLGENSSFLEILLNSDGILEFFNNLNAVNTISEIDKKNKEEIESLKEDLEKKKLDNLDKTEEIELNMKKLEKEKEEMEKNKKEVQKELNELILKENGLKFNNDSLKYLENLVPSDNEKVNKVIEEAKKYLGIPYVWGGTTPKGFDCSGLMQYVFRTVGVNLPRVSQQQQFFGTRIPFSQAEMGDLIYWGTPAHHVGLYLGNGLVLHAPRTGDVVKISPVWGTISSATRVL